jgi:aldose 1-epimerase
MVLTLVSGGAMLRLAPELGARVTRLALQPEAGAVGEEILFPFPEDTSPEALLHWPKGGIYPLVPYSNRIRDAELHVGGTPHRLPPHPDAAPHTLHGHAHRLPWAVLAQAADSVALDVTHPGGGEWPWRFTASLAVRLEPQAAHFALTLTNDDDTPMPAGLGLHPYFLHDTADLLGFRAQADWPLTADFLAAPPVAAPEDHDPPQPLPPGGLTLYRGDWDGACHLRRPDGTILSLAAENLAHLVVHRPDDGRYLCLEPTSHAADGFNHAERGVLGSGRVLLAPAQMLSATVTIRLGRDVG